MLKLNQEQSGVVKGKLNQQKISTWEMNIGIGHYEKFFKMATIS